MGDEVGWRQDFQDLFLDCEVVSWTIPAKRGEPHRYSLLWYCGDCGAVYAKSRCVNPYNGQQQEWMAVRLGCEKCPPQWDGAIPGSVWMSWDKEWNESLPLPVLQREFELHYEHFRKKGEIAP